MRLAEIQDAEIAKNSPAHHRTTLPGYILATKAHIENRKNVLSSDISILQTTPQYGELKPTSH